MASASSSNSDRGRRRASQTCRVPPLACCKYSSWLSNSSGVPSWLCTTSLIFWAAGTRSSAGSNRCSRMTKAISLSAAHAGTEMRAISANRIFMLDSRVVCSYFNANASPLPCQSLSCAGPEPQERFVKNAATPRAAGPGRRPTIPMAFSEHMTQPSPLIESLRSRLAAV